jgi:hypothetical protein
MADYYLPGTPVVRVSETPSAIGYVVETHIKLGGSVRYDIMTQDSAGRPWVNAVEAFEVRPAKPGELPKFQLHLGSDDLAL